MHQNNIKRNFLRHHSIPILLVRSIPIGCIVALLLLMGNLFVVDFGGSFAYADEPDPDFGGFGGEDIALSPEDQNAGIDLQAASSSLTVGSPTLSGSTEPGGIAYTKSNVTYSVVDTTSWALQVSYASGSSALAYVGSGGTTIEGAGNDVALTDNKWGYNWTDDKDAGQPATYRTMPNYGSPATMKSGATNASTTGAIHFAAKFGSNATPGHYKTNVLLSLVSTAESVTYYQIIYDVNGGTGDTPPSTTLQASGDSAALVVTDLVPTKTDYIFLHWKDSNNKTYAPGAQVTLTSVNPTLALTAVWKEFVPWSDMTTMQQMTTKACTDVPDNTSKTLTDTRDNSTYTVKKLSDNNCWMTQNLRIINKKITPADSNVDSDYTIPASALWNAASGAPEGAYYNNNTTYGAYYTYYTATAGTNPSSGDVTSSICPKGWRLPTGGFYTGDLYTLYNNGKSSWTTNSGKNGYWIGADSAAGGAFFVAAGYVVSGALTKADSNGMYWSGTVREQGRSAYYLSLSNSSISASGSTYMYSGYSVRCIAQ